MYIKNIVSTVSIKKMYPHERRHTDGDGGGVGDGVGGRGWGWGWGEKEEGGDPSPHLPNILGCEL